MVFQCRVKPGSYKKHGNRQEEWTVENQADIRPYGIIMKKA